MRPNRGELALEAASTLHRRTENTSYIFLHKLLHYLIGHESRAEFTGPEFSQATGVEWN